MIQCLRFQIGLELIETYRSRGHGLTAFKLAELTGWPRPSIRRSLMALCRAGLVEYEPGLDRRGVYYRPTAKLVVAFEHTAASIQAALG